MTLVLWQLFNVLLFIGGVYLVFRVGKRLLNR